MIERIICAAIKIVETGKVFYGHRHDQCQNALNGELSWNLTRQQITKLEKVQGFVTTQGRFVDRREALKIAIIAGQLHHNYIQGKQELYSEDLY